MSTFIGQLIGFAAIVLLVVRYVVPPVRNLMAARQNTVRQQLDDSATAAERWPRTRICRCQTQSGHCCRSTGRRSKRT